MLNCWDQLLLVWHCEQVSSKSFLEMDEGISGRSPDAVGKVLFWTATRCEEINIPAKPQTSLY